MILNRLVEFAERIPDLPPSGYQPAFITKIIRLGSDGTLTDVIAPSGAKRGKREGKVVMVPREAPQRTVAVTPRLVADNVNYVLGKCKEGDKPEKVQARHAAFRKLIAECAEETKEPKIEAIATWLEKGGAEALRDTDLIAEDDELLFEVDGVYPTDLPTVRQFWTSRAATEAEGVCLVTGKRGPVVDRMPAPIKGVPDGQMSGTALISVNNPAGESFGLSAALNSPISPYAAETTGNALNYLLNSDEHRLRVGNAAYLCWTREPEPDFTWEILNNPTPEHVQKLLGSPLTGARGAAVGPGAPTEADFFVLSLTANASRIVVRDYLETTLVSVKANLARWFSNLEIVAPDGSNPKPAGLFRLAVSLFREVKEMPAHVPTALLLSAIKGVPLPDYILGLAVKRNLAMQGPFTEFNKKRFLSAERLSLIKAVLCRGEEPKTLMALNKNHPSPAYHCGRLLSILESIQRAAITGLNTTLVDRTYGAASGSPAGIFGTLVKDATSAHLPKLRKNHAPAYYALDERLREALGGIGDVFPKSLNLQEQGLFALGYYHQRANDISEARARGELKAIDPTDGTGPSDDNETGENE